MRTFCIGILLLSSRKICPPHSWKWGWKWGSAAQAEIHTEAGFDKMF
jgi:hypothetical protein